MLVAYPGLDHLSKKISFSNGRIQEQAPGIKPFINLLRKWDRQAFMLALLTREPRAVRRLFLIAVFFDIQNRPQETIISFAQLP